jgi:hypothetical protein
MKKTQLACLFAVSMSVFAAPIVTQGGTTVIGEGLYTSELNTTTINFNGGTAPSSGPIIYLFPALSVGNIVTGNLANEYASPANDTTPYLTLGPAGNRTPVTINFNQLVEYFGFYASSVDDFNQIQFRNGGNTVLTLSGTQIATLGGFAANGNTTNGIYVNIFASGPSEYFDQIILSSSSNAFETDNHAFRAVAGDLNGVPEPSTWAMAGLGVAGLALSKLRRRR